MVSRKLCESVEYVDPGEEDILRLGATLFCKFVRLQVNGINTVITTAKESRSLGLETSGIFSQSKLRDQQKISKT